jgi:hypothetical protein
LTPLLADASMRPMQAEFQSPEEVDALVVAVIGRLKSAGLDAGPLEQVRSTAYTTGSEWLGELGFAVIEAARQPISDPQLTNDLRRLLRHVQGVWPSIRRAEKHVLPERRARALWNRYVGTIVWGLVAAGIFRSVIAAAMRGDEPWPLLLLRSAIGLIFVWAAWYAWTSMNWYRRVTRIMRHVKPIPVRIGFSYVAESALISTLTPTSPSPLQKVCVMCEEPSWDFKALEGSVVEAFIDPEPEGPVIIRTPSGFIWPHERGRVERTFDKTR